MILKETNRRKKYYSVQSGTHIEYQEECDKSFYLFDYLQREIHFDWNHNEIESYLCTNNHPISQ